MQLNDDYRSEVERQMVYAMISGLENSQLSSDQLPEISQRILEDLPKAKTHQQLMLFLEEMTKKWNIFAKVANAEMAKMIERQKEKVVQQMLIHAKQGNINEALKAAEVLKPAQQ